MSWMNHDLQNRECHLERLLEHVRLPLMSQDFIIQRVEAEPLMKRNSRCKDFLIEAMKYHLLKMDQRMLYQSPRTLPRHPVDLPKVLTFSNATLLISCSGHCNVCVLPLPSVFIYLYIYIYICV